MADYWKSQPKKFCSYCKCWIADNKPSIEFHERGKNHKENVVKKINEIKQKSMAKAKQDKKKEKEFAAMEEAALKAYEEDLKRLEGTTKPAPLPLVGPTIEEKRARDEQKWKEMDDIEKLHAKRQWTKGFSAEGHPFYYNALTGVTQWEEPDGFQENSEKSKEQGAKAVWTEGISDEGHTYYYNTETGESRWEKPEDFEYSVPSSKAQKNSPATEETAAGTEKVTDIEKEAASTENEAADTENEAADTENEAAYIENEATDTEKEATEQELKPEALSDETKSAEETTPAAPVTKLPKIHLQSKKEGQKDNGAVSETESQEEGTESKEETDVKNKVKTNEPSQELSSKRPRRTNPYGAWEQVKQEEDPYENVDLELPNVECDDTEVQVPDVPGEPKVKFKEKIITSLGDTEPGTFGFKKRRLQNVKSRNIRQRQNDQ